MAVGKQLEIPNLQYTVDAEKKLLLSKYGRVAARLRRDPTFAARLLHGIIVPPHQRSIWRGAWQEFSENHLVGSRGTAKSSSLAMALTIRGETRTRRKLLALSASKFRGGKIIMEESVDFIFGRLKDQRLVAPFPKDILEHRAGVKKEGDRWLIPFSTYSVFATIPTGNHESARGWRANWLFLDEADNWEREVIGKYFEPFLAVGTSFERTSEGGAGNAIFYGGTVSYAHKDWAETLEDRMQQIKYRYEAQIALKQGDYREYRRLMNQDNSRLWNLAVNLQVWDYTDLVIPTVIKNPRTGEPIYDVHYPVINRSTGQVEVSPKWIKRYDRRDKKHLIYTYPVEKSKIESPLDDGLTDVDVWAAENRCEIIKSSGSVYSESLLKKITTTPLVSAEDCAALGWDMEERGEYLPPLMYECKAPCVLGVDPARTADFCAFVVIRIGDMADPDKAYDPFTGEGHTPWNNVIWAEQRRGLTIKEITYKIQELKERYNLVVSSPNPELAYAIGIDARGAAAGTTVQDELANPSPEVDPQGNINPGWVQPQVMYDPTGPDYKHLAMNPKAWPGLRLLWTTDALNTEWVSYSKGQMEQNKLYIAKHLAQSERADTDPRLDAGYVGALTLLHQLRKIQAQPTKYHMKFVMPGDKAKIENKDDLFNAFLYAVSALRAHVATLTRKRRSSPTPAGIVVSPKVGSSRRRPFYG